jgi:hypothetical protein
VSSGQPLEPDKEREKLVTRRKMELWMIAIAMITSFCVGTTIVFLIAWLLLKYILPI